MLTCLYIAAIEAAIINSSFTNNNANTGGRCGAICTESGRGTHIFGSTFSDNNMASSGGFSRGALYIDDGEHVSILNCYFSNNTASLGNFSGGAICVKQAEATISNSYFINNNAATGSNYSGNALYMSNGDMTVINNSFCNKKPESNHAIYVNGGNITITDNRFIINDTASSGDHHDQISCLRPYTVIRSISNTFSDSTAADYCGLPNTDSTDTITTTDNNAFITTSSATVTSDASTTPFESLNEEATNENINTASTIQVTATTSPLFSDTNIYTT